jgi:hypothetical protein
MQSNSFAAMSPALIDAIAKVKAMTHLSKGERHKIGERVMALIEDQERIAARTNEEMLNNVSPPEQTRSCLNGIRSNAVSFIRGSV